MDSTLIKNIGQIFSGDIRQPVIEADSIIIEGGRIAAIGAGLAAPAGARIIDAQGTTVMPGLIDNHCHPVIGDWSPRQSTLGWIDNYLRAGVTGLISAGETHIPGKPKDAEGCLALAVLSYKTFNNARPAGMKVYGGAYIMQPDAKEEDFAKLAAMGAGHSGEIGLGGANRIESAGPMIEWGRKHGFKFLCHRGASYLFGSTVMEPDTVVGLNPDVICHVTYGDISLEDIDRFFAQTGAHIEFCRTQHSNITNTISVLDKARERGEMHRIILGNDAPSGFGIYAHGIWEMICLLTACGRVEPAAAVACATGNTAELHNLETGRIKNGCWADLLVCDAPAGSGADSACGSLAEGTIPGVSLVLLDGQVMAMNETVNTAPAKRPVVMNA
ncbi:amidohydrolase family protein [Deltaproteobacteria bacterium OttesenSCG-928-M10]|nr:amidohydrolase family protein [Deltaproteobacteria bacterium OttesenSCG-928-M10]